VEDRKPPASEQIQAKRVYRSNFTLQGSGGAT
jgi:hypothetical protein